MERSKQLHNFNLSEGLSWGRQTLLRCMKVNPVRAMAAVDDGESTDSGKDPQNRSVENSRAKMEGIEGEENSPPSNSKSKRKGKSKVSPRLKICSEGGADGGINADAKDLRSEKKSTRPRRNLYKKADRPKFSIALSRKEIEEDFIALTGKKPTRKPNKLSRSLQLKLDAVTPGLWLSEVHPDRYKVNENGKI